MPPIVPALIVSTALSTLIQAAAGGFGGPPEPPQIPEPPEPPGRSDAAAKEARRRALISNSALSGRQTRLTGGASDEPAKPTVGNATILG